MIALRRGAPVMIVLALLSTGAGCASTTVPAAASASPATLTADVARTLPVPPVHTQGLEFLDAQTIVQSYGLYGHSGVRLIDSATGAVRHTMANDPAQFGEGITRRPDGTLLQLTWRERLVNVIDPATLSVTATLPLDTEGWGACVDSAGVLWTSDGSATLTARNPATITAERTISVTRAGIPVRDLNELECTPEGIWANVWHTDHLILISPDTGHVRAGLDLTALSAAAPRSGPHPRREQVLNGIASDPSSGLLFVTGKDWTAIYGLAVRVVDADDSPRLLGAPKVST